ncbi:hypothetical protein RQP46_005814 [Phenoliferia psychrophenolica]
MNPERVQLIEEGEGGNHTAGPSRGRGGRGRGRGGARGASSASQGIPGSIPAGSISKLKAQLRQTRRLLARDDLTPDVRATSERRLKALELELEKTSQGELEKKMVTRYRGIRFFERQKLLRKIKQTKKALVGLPADPALTQTLLETRIDLYYVLVRACITLFPVPQLTQPSQHYPKIAKYIALFPEGAYVPHAPSTSSTAKDAANTRATMREDIRKKMDSGVLAPEPEVGDLGIEGEEDVGSGAAGEGGEAEGKKRGSDEVEEVREEAEERPAKKVRTEAPRPVAVAAPVAKAVVAPVVVKEVAEVKETTAKKAKKDAKDAKRREAKEAAAKAAAGVVEEPVKARTTAFDDDFFE